MRRLTEEELKRVELALEGEFDENQLSSIELHQYVWNYNWDDGEDKGPGSQKDRSHGQDPHRYRLAQTVEHSEEE